MRSLLKKIFNKEPDYIQPKLEKMASCYRRKDGKFYICAMSRFSGGGHLGSPPYLSLPADATETELGQTLRQAAAGTVDDYDVSPREYVSPFIEMAGVKSHGAFTNKARLIDITFKKDSIQLSPLKNNKRGLFTGMPDNIRHIPLDSSDEELGKAALQCLEEAIVVGLYK